MLTVLDWFTLRSFLMPTDELVVKLSMVTVRTYHCIRAMRMTDVFSCAFISELGRGIYLYFYMM